MAKPAHIIGAVALVLAALCSRQGGAEAVAPLAPAEQAAVLAALDRAPAEGLAAFDTRSVRALLASTDPAQAAAGAARLESMAVAYAAAEHGQRIAPGKFPRVWAIRPASYDARADFNAARAGRRLASWLAALPPKDPRYAALVEAYRRYAAIAAAGGWRVLPAAPLRTGASGPAVRLLLERLKVEDPSVTVGSAYDDAATAAIERAQARYGLGESGVADKATLAALNVPAPARMAQIAANLERLRWMDRDPPGYRVELNIAAQALTLFDNGRPSMQMRAIVGRPDRQTPSFRDAITAVVFNPPWNVPADIAAGEIWPKARRDPGYLKREGYVVRPGGGLQQTPGPKCALGAVKFDLSNAFGVYMHDTPSRSLFTRDLRLFSHGCMRLEHPLALAERVLAGDPAWPPDRIEAAVERGATVRAPLHRPVPVWVVYWTAFVDPDGALQLRADPYGWDRRLLAILPG